MSINFKKNEIILMVNALDGLAKESYGLAGMSPILKTKHTRKGDLLLSIASRLNSVLVLGKELKAD